MAVETAAGSGRRQGWRTQEAIHDAALRSFAEQGYASTSLRQLATEVGVEVGSLYRHFTSKEDLLFTLIRDATEEFHDLLVAAVDAAGVDPVGRLRSFVEEVARYHAEHRSQAFVGMVELRELTAPHRAEAIALRDRIEAVAKDLVAACRDDGYYPEDVDVSVTTKLLLSAGTGVAVWFDPAGPLTPQQVAADAARFAVPVRQRRRGSRAPARDAASGGARPPR